MPVGLRRSKNQTRWAGTKIISSTTPRIGNTADENKPAISALKTPPWEPWAGTRICNPASNIGWEKSHCNSRSAVIEMAAMPSAASRAFMLPSSSLTVGLTRNSDRTFICLAISSQSSMLKPVSRPFSSKTKGRIWRVATRRFSPFDCARAAPARRQRKRMSMGVFIFVMGKMRWEIVGTG